MTELAAVLWDMDGTLVDTEPLWMAAEGRIAAEHGKVWTEQDGLDLVGSALEVSGEIIRTKLDLPLTSAEIVDRLVTEVAAGLAGGDASWRPGALELFKALDAEGVPQALVTMSYVPLAKVVADQLPFAAVVTGDAVTHGKPHPEPYETAARMLGVDPAACVAVEDSATGATSANAAGCQVLAVPHMVDIPAAPRRTRRTTLAGMTPDDLRALLA